MKNKESIVVCPCCETKLWIDRETGGIIKHVQPSKGKENLKDLLNKYKEHKAGLGSALSRAFDEEKKRKEIMHRKFKNAMENIDELEDPGKPFDNE